MIDVDKILLWIDAPAADLLCLIVGIHNLDDPVVLSALCLLLHNLARDEPAEQKILVKL